MKDSMVPAIWKVATRDASVCGLDGGGGLGDGDLSGRGLGRGVLGGGGLGGDGDANVGGGE